MKIVYMLLLAISLNACAYSTDKSSVQKINLDSPVYNSMVIDLEFKQVITLFEKTFSRNTMGKRTEKTYNDSKLKYFYQNSSVGFDINKISAIKTKKKFFKNYIKTYGCDTLDSCYLSRLWYDGIRNTSLYKHKGKSGRLQGDYEVIISAKEPNKTTLTIIGDDLALNLGTKCCSLRTLQPYDNLYTIRNEELEEYRILMHLEDKLKIRNIHFKMQNNNIIPWDWR